MNIKFIKIILNEMTLKIRNFAGPNSHNSAVWKFNKFTLNQFKSYNFRTYRFQSLSTPPHTTTIPTYTQQTTLQTVPTPCHKIHYAESQSICFYVVTLTRMHTIEILFCFPLFRNPTKSITTTPLHATATTLPHICSAYG
eukprot:UN02968